MWFALDLVIPDHVEVQRPVAYITYLLDKKKI